MAAAMERLRPAHLLGSRAPSFVPARKAPRFQRHPCVVASVAAVASDPGLERWLAAQGVELGKAAVALLPGGLVTSRPVSRGEVLFAVPEDAWLSMETVRKSELGPVVKDLEPWLALTLWLLAERSKPSSSWGPYLASLDASAGQGSPLLWSEEELEWLAGTQLLSSVASYREYFQQRHAELQSNLLSSSSGLFSPDACTFEAFLKAVCIVRARVHAPLEGANLALVPLADLTQHRRGRSAAWQLRPTGLFGSGQAVVLEAEADMDAGEPVAMDFGAAKTDGQVLLDHGCIDPSTSVASYSLTLGPSESDPYIDDKVDILDLAGLPYSVELLLRGDGKLDERLLPLMRLSALRGADAFLLESVFRSEAWDHMQLPVSEDNEAGVCSQLIDGCRAALAAYPTTIDQDLALLRTAVPPGTASAADDLVVGSRQHAAVRVRLGEKEALDASLQLLEARVAALEQLEYYAERRLKRLGLLDEQGKRTDWDGFFEDGIA